jgi:HlyD family secretion protein
VLARLDTAKLQAQRSRVRAQLQSAEARLEDAQASLNESNQSQQRQNALRRQGLSTTQTLETTTATLARARANIDAAQADIAISKADLSPIDGVVLKRSVEPGQTVASSFQAPVLFTLAQDLKRIQLELNVDEADVGVVKPGQPASFSVDAFRSREFPARIESMSFSPETVDGVVTYKTVLSAENEDLALRPGMTTTAKIVIADHQNVLTVPNEALRYSPPKPAETRNFSITQIFMPRFPRNERTRRPEAQDAGRTVWVMRNGEPAETSVKTGDTDGKVTIITEGDVKPDDQLVTAARTARP